jgi:hypothetical protein
MPARLRLSELQAEGKGALKFEQVARGGGEGYTIMSGRNQLMSSRSGSGKM